MDYICQHSLPNPINNPLIITLLVFAFTIKCYHYLCFCHFVVSLCAGILRTKHKTTCAFLFLVIVFFFQLTCVVLMSRPNMSTFPALAVMNVCTITAFTLRLFQHYLPITSIFFYFVVRYKWCECPYKLLQKLISYEFPFHKATV